MGHIQFPGPNLKSFSKERDSTERTVFSGRAPEKKLVMSVIEIL